MHYSLIVLRLVQNSIRNVAAANNKYVPVSRFSIQVTTMHYAHYIHIYIHLFVSDTRPIVS